MFAIGFFAIKDTTAQCKQAFVYSCAKENGNAIYLRDFNVKLKQAKKAEEPPVARFSVVLNKGTKYRFNLCTPEEQLGDGAVLKLYDGKKRIGDTAMNPKADAFDFICKKSAIYYVAISMEDGKKGCAVGILSFVGKD